MSETSIMKMQIRNFLIFIILNAMQGTGVLAGDIARDIRQGGNIPDSSDGGYIEVGGGLMYFDSPIYGYPEDGQNETLPTSTINARYQINGFFVEAFSESQNLASLGYNAFNSKHWMFDLIVAPKNFEMSEEVSEKWRDLRKREMDVTFGVRLTGYYGDYIAQFQFVHDISDPHNGYIGIANIGRGWQMRN